MHPVSWLPGAQKKVLRSLLANPEITELKQVPDALLTDLQHRVKTASLTGKKFFDGTGAAAAFKPHKLPAYFLDFETISPAAPLWAGTRPFQQVPFQFLCHRLGRTGRQQRSVRRLCRRLVGRLRREDIECGVHAIYATATHQRWPRR